MVWTPPDILKPILSKGGEIALGLAYALGRPVAFIERLYVRRFRLTDPDARRELDQFALAGAAVGKQIAQLDPDQFIPLDVIPENPYLYGGDPQGRRIFVVGQATADSGENWFQRRTSFPDQMTYNDLLGWLLGELESIHRDSPNLLRGSPPTPPVEPEGEILFMERGF